MSEVTLLVGKGTDYVKPNQVFHVACPETVVGLFLTYRLHAFPRAFSLQRCSVADG
jgi:hypothetical protein